MKHFRLVDGHGGVIDAQSFRTTDEAHAWATTHPRAELGTWILEEQVDGDWQELPGPDDE
ncbi:hypothetical protein [Rhodococcus phenolicus]|uniref:hypothetical protein n=1 Tax=Rhodococcus phenolicus TaxID=263849 RepID=UPI0008341CA5|nr:hypothetical protein [Rhodococcus phenolicus]